jgi:hypothetical protein
MGRVPGRALMRVADNDEDEKSSAINKIARRANRFRFTEIVVNPQNKKYFAFPEVRIELYP